MESFERTFAVDAAQPVFAGHFPGQPILPGVLTLALVRRALGEAHGRPWRLRSIRRQKFVRPVVPGDSLTVACRVTGREAGALDLDCRFSIAGGTLVGSAQLRVEPA